MLQEFEGSSFYSGGTVVSILLSFCLHTGLVRGIDPDNRKLYLTTPLRLDKETLQSVNVFVLGNPDSLSDIFQVHRLRGQNDSLAQ